MIEYYFLLFFYLVIFQGPILQNVTRRCIIEFSMNQLFNTDIARKRNQDLFL